MADVDIDYLRTWIGREQHKADTISPRLVESYNSIFNAEPNSKAGEIAPVGIQWCLAPDMAPMKELGPDGHPERGGFLPPIAFPRRMWAGGNLTFSGAFRVGDEIVKHSVIKDVVLKTGRTGPLIFVTVHHDYEAPRGLVLSERQDIVYRERDGTPATSTPVSANAAPEADRIVAIDASTPLLFRYSAVTFNGHRIHYDFNYAANEEGYPGLIFHGPLQASYLLRMAVTSADGSLPRDFSFRSVKPLYAGGHITANAKALDGQISLWIADQQGQRTMEATAIG